MSDLIKLVKTYRMSGGLADRLRLAEKIFCIIEPDLRAFIFSTIKPIAAQDVLQEVLKGIAIGLTKFAGGTAPEFWGWCYAIARNKLNDHYRSKASDRIEPMPPEELTQMMEASTQGAELSAQTKLDLAYVMDILTAAKPDCYELLMQYYVIGFDYAEIADERNANYDAVRMKIGRCLDEAKSLVA